MERATRDKFFKARFIRRLKPAAFPALMERGARVRAENFAAYRREGHAAREWRVCNTVSDQRERRFTNRAGARNGIQRPNVGALKRWTKEPTGENVGKGAKENARRLYRSEL